MPEFSYADMETVTAHSGIDCAADPTFGSSDYENMTLQAGYCYPMQAALDSTASEPYLDLAMSVNISC
jgi:hypothetical protein